MDFSFGTRIGAQAMRTAGASIRGIVDGERTRLAYPMALQGGLRDCSTTQRANLPDDGPIGPATSLDGELARIGGGPYG